MHKIHSHSHEPTTQGIVIHRASLYQKFFGLLLRPSEGRVVELAKVKTGDKVLDAGCGPGTLSIRAKKEAGQNGKVYGIDASPEMIELARQNALKAGQPVDFQLGVIEDFPFADNTFDVVLSRFVIHHLPGDLKRKGFAEMYRVLKPGGYCLVADFDPKTVPLPAIFLKPFFSKIGMLNIDTMKYLPLIEEAGFTGLEGGPTGKKMVSFVRGRKPE